LIGDIQCPLPESKEQTIIASFLDRETSRIDTLISEKERLISLLQEYRQALISHTVTKGLDPKVKMKDSGVEWLGEIPEHWEVKRLKFLGQAIIGLTYDPSEVVEEGDGILVLRSSNVQGGQIVFDDNVFVRKAVPEKILTKLGDILICSRNGSRALIGKNAVINDDSVGLTFGAFMTIFRSKHNPYLSYVFNSSLFEFQSGSFLTSTVNQLTTSNLYSFEVPLPPNEEQFEIASFLDRETSRIDTLISETKKLIDLLKEYRSSLITAAVTGKIDVREVVPSGSEKREIAHE
jgi:type I restriction enzyme S subunit